MRGLWGVQEGIIKETLIVLTLNTSSMPCQESKERAGEWECERCEAFGDVGGDVGGDEGSDCRRGRRTGLRCLGNKALYLGFR